MKRIHRLIYLSSAQGASTSVAAAVLGDCDLDPETVYLQPYRLLFQRRKKAPFPMLEMLGPYAGYVETKPRLPEDGGVAACQSLFKVCEELTGCHFPQPEEMNT